MKAISIHPYWAWAIVNGHKRFENRTWGVKHRGPLAIHAGQSKASDAAALELFAELGIAAPPPEEITRGAIVGVVELVDVVDYDQPGLFSGDGDLNSDPFAVGPKCWVLENPRQLAAPIACPGRQGLWEAPMTKAQ